MDNAIIRQQLHQFIEVTDDAKIEALYVLLQNDIQTDYLVTEDELNVLHERAEKYLKGETPVFSVNESHNKIRQQGLMSTDLR